MLALSETPQTQLLDTSRIPLQPSALALPTEQAVELLEEHQARVKTVATRLLEHDSIQNAIQVWRQDLLTSQTSLKEMLQPFLQKFLQNVPIFERARAARLHLRHHDLSAVETFLTLLKILVPPLLLLGSVWYCGPSLSIFSQEATTYSIASESPAQLSKELSALCPAGFVPTPRLSPLLRPVTLKPLLSDYTCRELRCDRGFVLKGGSCYAVNCTAADQIYDGAWGFCVPRDRTVPGIVWGQSSCDAKLTWFSLFDLACWASYMRLWVPWMSTQLAHAANNTLRIVTGVVSALLLLSFLRISWSAATQFLKKLRSAKMLDRFIIEAEAVCLEKLEYRFFQTIVPRLFTHLDTLQSMPPVQRAIAVAEMGFTADGESVEALEVLKPLYVKCIQDVVSQVNTRNFITLLEADLVESRQFPTLIQWIEDSSKEFRDEVGRVRAQRALLTFQEDVRSAVGALSTAGKSILRAPVLAS